MKSSILQEHPTTYIVCFEEENSRFHKNGGTHHETMHHHNPEDCSMNFSQMVKPQISRQPTLRCIHDGMHVQLINFA